MHRLPQQWGRKNVKVLMLLLLLFSEILSQDKNYFYRGLDYGSESMLNPITLIINGGLGILQVENRSRYLKDIKFYNGLKNVFANLSDPITSIKEYGVKDFIFNEILPVRLNRKNAQFWPNYQNHLIGGGLAYREMVEWYRMNRFKHPKLFSILTMAVYHLLNEIVENNDYTGRTVDPIADLYIFDPLGILLFNFDSVCEFFSEKLNLAEWSYQPAIDFIDWRIENMGQNYSIKYKLINSHFYFFYHFGMNGLVGLSYEFKDYEFLSFGAGLRAKRIVRLDEKTNSKFETATLSWNLGFFYDRNNSLLFSILLSGVNNYKAVMNIYPGLISIKGLKLGLFTAFDGKDRFVWGISLRSLHFGIASKFFINY